MTETESTQRVTVPRAVDAWGQAPGTVWRLVPVLVTGSTALGVAFLNGLATWSLIFFGGHYAFWLPFAAIGLLVTVELYVMATWWFDAPSVSRGMGVGMILGGLVFLTVFVLVVQSLGAG